MLYPAFLNLKGKSVLVVGGGEVATRKIAPLIKAGARVRVASPEATAEIRKLSAEKRIKWLKRPFVTKDLDGAFLVVAATNNEKLHHKLFIMCQRRGALLNVVDAPKLCNFYVPSLVRRGKLQIAISTEGASPRLAKNIRLTLEKVFGGEFSAFTQILSRLRPKIQKEVSAKRRSALYDALIKSDILKLCKVGKNSEARKLAEKIVLKFTDC